MTRLGKLPNRRILIIDDQELVHYAFRSILGRQYHVDFASQGEAGVEKVRVAARQGRAYAVAFVDLSMPPGIDGVETLSRLWEIAPDLEAVLCTGQNDFTWADIAGRLGQTDRLLILKKPFDNAEVLQLACALTKKWWLGRRVQLNMAELETMVEARTREIERAHADLVAANRDLAAARDAAEAASRAKSEFLANMSHEIRTPMTAILGFADMLQDCVHEPEGLGALETIKRNGTYLLEILGDILDLSKIEAGRLELEELDCSPGEIVTEVACLMQVRAEARRLFLETECDGPIPGTIRSDPTRLRQVLFNLVGNAIKFTQTGGVRLVTRTLDGPGVTRRIQFDVIDTGVGMTEDEMARLFQPFVQADSSTTRKFGGTGLGLTISRRLATMLDGEITASRNPDGGCTFRLTMLAREAADPPRTAQADPAPHELASSPATPQSSPPECQAPPAPRLDGVRILFAEDGPDNQRLVVYVLNKAGAQTVVAENGEAAVEMVRAAQRDGRPFDLVLLDMQMPVRDGYQAARDLRTGGYGGPIIALTAHAMKGDRKKCLAAGCDDYMAKPIDRRQLVELVARYAAIPAAR